MKKISSTAISPDGEKSIQIFNTDISSAQIISETTATSGATLTFVEEEELVQIVETSRKVGFFDNFKTKISLTLEGGFSFEFQREGAPKQEIEVTTTKKQTKTRD